MFLLARAAALCCVLTSLLAVTASPLLHSDSTLNNLERRTDAKLRLIQPIRVPKLLKVSDTEGPAFLIGHDAFALVKKPDQHHEVYHYRFGAKEGPVSQPKFYRDKGQIYDFGSFHFDNRFSNKVLVERIQKLKPNSFEEFKIQILGCLKQPNALDHIPAEIRTWLEGSSPPASQQSGGFAPSASGQESHAVTAGQQPEADTRPGTTVSSLLNPQLEQKQSDARPGTTVSSLLNPRVVPDSDVY
ncbi:hypothetical protein GYMLUDRAFT_41127 [Collybiopsis luxurians FD-317 M1]|uniref:Uncharacterized protein n=1 Tax=Collybiopsis luxurians FD-317 M1 TaxID=944289 RepID=A0A0D0C5P0_9AGAR|nr:hypothetical protein GYMLUDRAFT_41127 [Collybiopsis luxurians FD-317 M1]